MDGATRFARRCSLCFVSTRQCKVRRVLRGTLHCVLVVCDIYWSDIHDILKSDG